MLGPRTRRLENSQCSDLSEVFVHVTCYGGNILFDDSDDSDDSDDNDDSEDSDDSDDSSDDSEDDNVVNMDYVDYVDSVQGPLREREGV